MKNYERESLLKNFWVFFSLLEILLVLLFLELYHTEKREYNQSLLKTMQLCSYTYECTQFDFEFTPKGEKRLNELYDDQNISAYFPVPKSKKYNVRIIYPHHLYTHDLHAIRRSLWLKFILATILLMGVALFFTFYSLKPIRQALRINDEFIKDILHDFNTPISSIVLNLKMFQDQYESNIFIQRINHSIDTILLLQNNLKSFLHHSPLHSECVDIALLTQKRMRFIQNLYPHITFTFEQENTLKKQTNSELLTRILDNLLTNAAKYNKPNGKVMLRISKETLYIEDTGKGMSNTKAVMQRYYKEQDRGLGLGLHIVQKLTSELNIKVKIDSKVDVGTCIALDFSDLSKGTS